MWQDYVIAVVVMVFNLTTVPMIRARVALPWLTVLPMVSGALLLEITYATMHLWIAVASESVALFLWCFLLSIKLEDYDG